MSDKTFQLLIQKGPEPGKVLTLNKDTMVVGRDPNSDIVIEDLEVSRQHARFLKGPGGYQLQDMGSTNGSFVDGARLGGEAVTLSAGQVIMFGSNVELIYQVIMDIDPMATMVAPAGALDAISGLKDEPADDALPAFDDDPLPAFDEPATEPPMQEDAFATMVDPPMGERVANEGLSAFDSDPAPLPSFDDEPAPLPSFDDEPAPLPSFDDEPAPLPTFDEPVKASAPELPQFDNTPVAAGPSSMQEPEKSGGFFSNRRNVIIAAVGGGVLICCCLSIIATLVLSSGSF